MRIYHGKKKSRTKGLIASLTVYFLVAFLLSLMLSGTAQAAGPPYVISDDATGGDCTTIGTWDPASKTCTLTTDLTIPAGVDGIYINSHGVTLDGNMHTLTGGGGQYGVTDGITYRTGVTVRNLTVTNFTEGICFGWWVGGGTSYTIENNDVLNNSSHGILLFNINGSVITGNATSGNGADGIHLEFSNSNIIVGNAFSNNSGAGIYLGTSHSNSLLGNNVSYNAIYGIYLAASDYNTLSRNTITNSGTGIYLRSAWTGDSDYNQIYNNNVINNTVQALVSGGSGNSFNLAAPIGGNYWNDFDEPAEGCHDANSDGFCDSPYVFAGGQDNLPWTRSLLINKTIEYMESLGLPIGIENSLISKLSNAGASLTKDQDGAAINILEALINQVEALRDKKIPSSQADEIIAGAQEVINAI